MASIVGLFVKPGVSAPMVAPGEARLELRAGYGVLGDANANPLSPRQVLVMRYEDLCHFGIEPGALRENIVVAGLDESVFVPGARLDVGKVSIRLTFHCEPCKRISHLITSLKDILNHRGLLGVVLNSNTIAVGDVATAYPDQYPALPERPYDRFRAFIAQVPTGRVVSYKHVTVGMGVAGSYTRAIPRYVLQSPTDNVHRIVDTEGGLIQCYVPKQAVRLRQENVEVLAARDLFGAGERHYVDLNEYAWSDVALWLDASQTGL